MNNHRTAAMILVGMSVPLMAQDCPPQTKTQKAVSWFNRARTGTPVAPAPAATGCTATAKPGSPDSGAAPVADGAIIDTGTLSGPAFLSGGPGSQVSGSIKFKRGLLRWNWSPDRNAQLPHVVVDFGGGFAGQTENGLRLEGKKGAAYYFSDFTFGGSTFNISLTPENGAWVLRKAPASLTGLTDLNGNLIEAEPEPAKPTYTFQPYTRQLEDALHKADAAHPGSGLNLNQHGGTLSVTTDGNTVTLALVHEPGDVNNFWRAQNDISKAFLIDNADTLVTPLLHQANGSWLSQDGKKFIVADGVGIVQ